MRKNIKYFILGFIAASTLASIPAIADGVVSYIGSVRVNIEGVDRVSWGEELDVGDGFTAPYSLIYNDTVYVPLRAMSELLDNQVSWNGDTNTVSVTSNLQFLRLAASKHDSEGNVWDYEIFSSKDGSTYLRVMDKDRGYARVYLMASSSVYVDDEAIYFARLKTHNTHQWANQAVLVKLPFENTPDTQDGETLYSLYPIETDGFAILGDYVFYAGVTSGNSPNSVLTALNYVTGEDVHYYGDPKSRIYDLRIKEGSDSRVVFQYKYLNENGTTYRVEQAYNKNSSVFAQPKVLEVLE